jgi:hypothetical protein
MTWARKFDKPIDLKDGRTIATLEEAREFILSLPTLHQWGALWAYAGDLLLEAAADEGSLPDAEAQLTRALKAEGLI